MVKASGKVREGGASRKKQKVPPGGAKEMNPKRLQAWDLRLRGYSYRAIAKKLQCDPSLAYRYVVDAMEEAKAHFQDTAAQHLQLELDRIERILAGLEEAVFPPDTTDKEIEEEDPESGAKVKVQYRPCLKTLFLLDKYMDRKAKLLGFYRADDSRVKETLPWSDDDGELAAGAPE